MKLRKTELHLQRLLERTLQAEPGVRGALLRVEKPNLTWAGAAGLCEPLQGLAMQPDDAFQIASISKTFTAALCLLLAEEGLVDLDRGIGAYLPPELTDGLHVVDGCAYGAEITLRQLLSHTSGLPDFFGDGAPGANGTPPFVAEMAANPDHLWQPREVIGWTKAKLSARSVPGLDWHYADTGFLLAGLVAEAVTEQALHAAYRRWIFEPLVMEHTYLLYREAARPVAAGRPASRPYVGDTDYGSLRSTSADWGSGGLVSTTSDLACFLRALIDDRLFRQPTSRAAMMSWIPTGETGVHYGLGLRRFDLEQLGLEGAGELWGHTGFLKAFMLYWPAADAILCGTLNQSAARGVFSDLRPAATLVRDVLLLLQNQ